MMANYILEASAIEYMLESFPRIAAKDLWLKFESICCSGKILAEVEARKELEKKLLSEQDSLSWIDNHKKLFNKLTEKGAYALGEIQKQGLFSQYNKSKDLIRKLPISTPFTISEAYAQSKVVVVYKKCKDYNEICNICEKLGIKCIDVEQFLITLDN